MHTRIRHWIADVIQAHPAPISIALRQRAKFEGWLKFSLAAHLELNGAHDVAVESGTSAAGTTKSRADISFTWDGIRYDLELKTPNTNWRMPGVEKKIRPITNNVASIVIDAKKASASGNTLLVAFVLFPIPTGDHRWQDYLKRIGNDLQISLPHESFAHQLPVPLSNEHKADVVVCCFAPNTAQRSHEIRPAA